MTHKFEEIFDAAARGEDIDELFEVRLLSDTWEYPSDYLIHLYQERIGWEYRRKVRMLELGGVAFPAPLTEEPEEGAEVYIADPARSEASKRFWENGLAYLDAVLRSGFLHSNEEAAEAHVRAIQAVMAQVMGRGDQ